MPQVLEVTSEQVEIAGHTTSYLACGPEDGPLVVFVHGWPELSRSWRHQLPVLGGLGFRAVAPDMRGYGASSVYPAVQNLLLAARAVGLGEVLTTRHRRLAAELKHLLNIPEEVNILCVVPLGFPAMSHGAKTRLPIEEVCYRDRWGLPLHLR